VIFIAVILLVFVGVWYLNMGAKKQSDTKSAESIKIGAILPLSGISIRYGELEKNGLEMALAEINGNGGINGRRLEIIYEDSKGHATPAVDAWSKITLDKKINLIFGTLSGVCQSLSPLANRDQIVLMASDCAVAAYSSSNDYTFRITSSNKREGEQMAQFLIARNIRLISILKINNDYGEGLLNFFSESYRSLGGEIKNIESYQPDQKDFKSELNKIKHASPQAVYLMSYAAEAEIILKQIKELKINFPIYAGEPFENYTLLKNVGTAADGVIYLKAALSADIGQLFVKNYEQKYGQKPEINPARTYDALNIMAQVLTLCDKKDSLNSQCLKDNLYTIKDYSGTIGKIGFDKYGDVDVPYTVKTVKNGQFVLLEQ
jgi:branched-chain amino acid transport system substrate-binding protein